MCLCIYINAYIYIDIYIHAIYCFSSEGINSVILLQKLQWQKLVVDVFITCITSLFSNGVAVLE